MNPQPADYKSAALPIELHQRINGASERNRTTDTGIFSPLLYRLSYRGKMATRMGLEPMTSAVTRRHSNQLNYRAVLLLCRCVSATCIIIRTMRHLVNTFSPSFSKKAQTEENPPSRPLFHHSAESSFSSLRSLWTSEK